jgi:hypothetical protein
MWCLSLPGGKGGGVVSDAEGMLAVVAKVVTTDPDRGPGRTWDVGFFFEKDKNEV